VKSPIHKKKCVACVTSLTYSKLSRYWCTLFHCDSHSKPYLTSDRCI